MESPTRWIVTGGTGFLATNLLHVLLPEDGEVVAIGRHEPRWPVQRDGIRYLVQDVREIDSFRHELTSGSVVVHMATSSYPGKAEKLIESDIQDNVLGTIRLAQACADQGVRALVFISSGGTVYGDPSILPVPEDASLKPISAYGAMKLTIEHYLHVLHLLRGLPVTSLRIGNPFGLWHAGEGQGAVNVFMKKLLRRKPIEIWGDGSQVRDFIFAEDVARAIRLVGLQFTSGSEVFNVGSGQGHSLLEMLERAQEVSGIAGQVSFLPSRGVDVRSNILQTTKVQEQFGWHVETDLDSALKKTWEWMRMEFND